jgi:hypothetical protein
MTKSRSNQNGFALLLVFALAAAIAIMFYLELPRLAFEAQRQKEELLVMRGEEHIRAIQLFMRKNGKWPQNLDELEKFNNLRYLRRRYKDPMTGSDEWRVVHVDPMGQLTDSLVHKKDKEKEAGVSVLASNIQGIGSSAEVVTPGGATQSSAALQRRASDRIIPSGDGQGGSGAPADPNQPPGGEGESRSGPTTPTGQPQPVLPGQAPGMPPGVMRPGTFPGGTPGSPFQPPTQTGLPGQPGQAQPGAAQPGATSGSSSSFGGGPAFGGTAFSGSSTGASTSSGQQAQPQYPNMPGQQQPQVGMTPGQPGQSNPALQMIQQIISNPRPQGQSGFQSGGVGGQQLGGGIAGVASKKDAEGIRVYKERTNYKEWEFLYDPKEEAKNQAGKQGIPGQNTNNQNLPGQPNQPVRQGGGMNLGPQQ